MMDLNSLLNQIGKHKEDIIKLASDLIKIPSVNPPGNMTQIANYLKDFFNVHGINVKWLEKVKGRVNLISEYGSGENILVLNGHMDVVPPGDESKWKFPPFSGEIINGYLCGRGASDMKGPLAALIYAYLIYVQSSPETNGKLILTIVPDEETGGYYGSKYLVSELGMKSRYTLIAEPSTIYAINIGEKGILWFKVDISGKPAHASMSPFIGENAILIAQEIINDIYKLVELDFKPPDDVSVVVDKSGELYASLMNTDSIRRIFRRLSCNIGLINGGVKTNIVAPNCSLEFDIRIPPGTSTSNVIEMIKNVLARYGSEVKFTVSISEEPNYTSPKSQIVSKLASIIESETGIKPILTLIPGATDGRFFREVGSETVIYGPAEWQGIHGYNEKVKVDELVIAAKIYLRLIYDIMS